MDVDDEDAGARTLCKYGRGHPLQHSVIALPRHMSIDQYILRFFISVILRLSAGNRYLNSRNHQSQDNPEKAPSFKPLIILSLQLYVVESRLTLCFTIEKLRALSNIRPTIVSLRCSCDCHDYSPP